MWKWFSVLIVGNDIETWKNPYIMRVDNWKVNAISILNVEYLLCEHWETSGDSSCKFKVYPQQFTVKINNSSVTLSNMKIVP